MKRKELIKRSSTIALALALAMQSMPLYAEEYESNTDVIFEESEDSGEEYSDTVYDASEDLTELDGTLEVNEEIIEVDTPVEIEEDLTYPEISAEDPEDMDGIVEEDPDIVNDDNEEIMNDDIYEDSDVFPDNLPSVMWDSPETVPVYESAAIHDLTVGEVETNSKYKFLSFLFGDEEGNLYECFVTGLEDLTDDSSVLHNFSQFIANRFISRDNTSAGVKIDAYDPIDAEKYDDYYMQYGWEEPSGYPYGDGQLCWAGAASNMLEFAGWNAPYADEDEAFTAFTNGFYDVGGYADGGIQWYMNGIFSEQQTTEDGQTVLFPDHLDHDAWITQLREPGTGGNYMDYYAGNVMDITQMYKGAPGTDYIAENLKAGNAVSMDVSFTDNYTGIYSNSHALTIFGYIRNTFEKGMEGLKALFIADSDNDKDHDDYHLYTEAKDTEEGRKNTVNSLSMEFLDIYSGDGANAYNMYSYSPYYRTTIDRLIVLNAKANVDDSCKEQEGTMDPENDPDLVFFNMGGINEQYGALYTGEYVNINLHTINMSYTGLKAEDDPTVHFLLTIYKDDEFYKEVPVDSKVVDYANSTGQGALRFHNFNAGVVFDEPGSYTVHAKILSITDKDGKEIKEAYTSNNEAEIMYTITKAPERQPGNNTSSENTQNPVKPMVMIRKVSDAEHKCICAKFGIKCTCEKCDDIKLEKDWTQHLLDEFKLSCIITKDPKALKIELPFSLELPLKENDKFHVFLDGELFCKDLYKLYNKDEVTDTDALETVESETTEEETKVVEMEMDEEEPQILEISDEIMRKIGSGDHMLVIETEEGYFLYNLQIK